MSVTALTVTGERQPLRPEDRGSSSLRWWRRLRTAIRELRPLCMSGGCWRKVWWTGNADSEGGGPMLIRPAEIAEFATPAMLKVSVKCGEKKQLSIEGVSIEFICERDDDQSEIIPEPHQFDPGQVALLVEDFPTLLERLPRESEIDTHADPVVFTVPHDRVVSLEDLSDIISICRRERRAIRFDIGSQRQ